MLKTVSIFLLCLSCAYTNAQQDISKAIEGYWEGALIKDNSYQKIDIQFFIDNEKLNSLLIIEEWHPQFGEFITPVEIDSLNQIKMNIAYGKAALQLDKNASELIGQIEGSLPTIYVHLKKVPDPPNPNYNIEAVEIQNGSVTLSGHLHQPKFNTSGTAIIMVGGRGCYAGETKYDLYAKLLRSYGISVLVFNKRGTGNSTGDCALATIDDLASDLVACKTYLDRHPNNYRAIGVIGSSAGGWVISKAEELTNFDFMISIVGPSTSVKEQQLQSMTYGFEEFDLSETAQNQLIEYTNLMFDAKSNTASFDKFKALLATSEEQNWKQLLDDTDIPGSVDGIDELWVRRHNYDPASTLANFDKPFLAIYGEKDWIVPSKENIERLEVLFTNDRRNLLTTVVAPNAQHGTETDGEYVKLANNGSYWRFFRISPVVQIEIIKFLKLHKFIAEN